MTHIHVTARRTDSMVLPRERNIALQKPHIGSSEQSRNDVACHRMAERPLLEVASDLATLTDPAVDLRESSVLLHPLLLGGRQQVSEV